MLVVAPADPRLEASCRYARSADERERDKLVDDVERRMTGENIWMGVDWAPEGETSYSVTYVRPRG